MGKQHFQVNFGKNHRAEGKGGSRGWQHIDYVALIDMHKDKASKAFCYSLTNLFISNEYKSDFQDYYAQGKDLSLAIRSIAIKSISV